MLSINITDTVSLTVLALSRRVLFSSIRGPPAETVTLCIFAKENTVELSLIFPMVYFSAAVLRLLTMVFMYHWRLYIFVSSRAITVEYMYGRWQYFSLLILLFVLFIFLIVVFFLFWGLLHIVLFIGLGGVRFAHTFVTLSVKICQDVLMLEEVYACVKGQLTYSSFIFASQLSL